MLLWLCVFLYLFKQKTAYEMRISDWSSDVCSSDLDGADGRRGGHRRVQPDERFMGRRLFDQPARGLLQAVREGNRHPDHRRGIQRRDRTSVVSGKIV